MSTTCFVFLVVGFTFCIVDANDCVSREEFQILRENLQEENRKLNLKLDDLKFQNGRLQEENRNMQKEIVELEEFKKQVTSVREEHNSKYDDLKTAMSVLKKDVDIIKSKDNANQNQLDKMEATYDKDNDYVETSMKSRERIKEAQHINRRLIGVPIPNEQTIAFSAFITPNFDLHIGANHVFVYDAVQCNAGNAYNNNSGIFTVPVSGIYAFLWTIAAEGTTGSNGYYGEVDTELVVNSVSRAKMHTDTETLYEDSEATGFVILYLNADDLVFIRTSGQPQGHLMLHYQKEWTFSGWKL